MNERRNQTRVCLHSVAKLSDSQKVAHYYGYVENLSESGFGLVSPDIIADGSQMLCSFFMEGVSKKLNAVATLVYARKEQDDAYRYGFHFDLLDEEDCHLIKRFVLLNRDESPENLAK